MMCLVYGKDREVADWVAARLPLQAEFDDNLCKALGVVSGGRYVAGVVYSDYQPQFRTMELSIAADSPIWAKRDIIRAILKVPFVEHNCFKALAITQGDNRACAKMLVHVGFRLEGVLEHQFGPGRAALPFAMTRPEFDSLYGTEGQING